METVSKSHQIDALDIKLHKALVQHFREVKALIGDKLVYDVNAHQSFVLVALSHMGASPEIPEDTSKVSRAGAVASSVSLIDSQLSTAIQHPGELTTEIALKCGVQTVAAAVLLTRIRDQVLDSVLHDSQTMVMENTARQQKLH